MMACYPERTVAPLAISAVLGIATVFYFFAVLGLDAFSKIYVWPGLLLTVFWVACLFRRDFHQWHRAVWRFAQIWSGFWVALFVLGITTMVVGMLFPTKWIEETHFNPWLAVLVHFFITACSSDVLRMTKPKA